MKSRWSIVTRLTALYTVVGFVMFALAAAFLHWTLASSFRRSDNQFLADKVRLLRTILQHHAGETADLKEEVQWETAAIHFARYYARILDAQGHIVIETPGMDKALPLSLFPSPRPVKALQPQVVSRQFRQHNYLLLSAFYGKPGGQVIQVALDVAREDDFLAHYRHSLALAVVFGVIFSALAGAWVARRGMRPLEDLTHATDRISASQLHERIAARNWPTELTALARGFDRMLDRLEESFRRLSQFSGDLAHELRTPINNLRGEAGVALSQSRTAAEYRQVLESSLEEFARLTGLIDNLLFLARADSPLTGISRVPVEAAQSVEVVRDYYEALAEDRGVTVQCEGQGQVYADPVLFRQAVSNLLSNALNHTPRGGRVTIHCRSADDCGLEVAVSDTGDGIAAEHLPHIFDRLYRADPARSQHPNGTGLGLSIVKSIMELHGGSVTVQTEPAKGSCFRLIFPGR